jgi:hypothetical protein
MRQSFGPWGVGAEVGHHIIVQVSYHFNVNTDIRRLNWHNFGHIYLHYVDGIQLRMLEIFGLDPFSCHANQFLFKPIKGFVAVGIDPLNYHSDYYVETGEPHEKLTGDLKFLAERTRLVGPPLHIAHRNGKFFQ